MADEMNDVEEFDPLTFVRKSVRVPSSWFGREFSDANPDMFYIGQVKCYKAKRGRIEAHWELLFRGDKHRYIVHDKTSIENYFIDNPEDFAEEEENKGDSEEKGANGNETEGGSSDEPEEPSDVEEVEELDDGGYRIVREWISTHPTHFAQRSQPINMPENPQTLSPFQMFSLLMRPALFRKITNETNRYFDQRNMNPVVLRDLNVTAREIYVFAGLSVAFSLVHMPNLDDYWYPRSSRLSPPINASNYMERNRFWAIKRYLHIADNKNNEQQHEDNRDKLHKLRPMIDELNYTFKRHWMFGGNVSLDEAMVGFKGANPFRRKIPSKPRSIGFKLYAVCCSEKYFCRGFSVDDSKGRTLVDIVLPLARAVMSRGQVVYFDRFYTTVDVFTELMHIGIGAVGTCKAARFPAKQLVGSVDEKNRGSYMVATNAESSMCASTWKDNGNVLMLSTAFSSRSATVTRTADDGGRIVVNAPEFARKFNDNMQGVDRMDQFRSGCYAIATRFRTRKWWFKLFLGLMDIVIANAFIMYRYYHPEVQHFTFAEDLAFGLLEADPFSEGTDIDEKKDLGHVMGLFAYKEYKGKMQRLTYECAVCSTLENRKRTCYGCKTCCVPLHPMCFVVYHGKPNMKPRRRRKKLIWAVDDNQ